MTRNFLLLTLGILIVLVILEVWFLRRTLPNTFFGQRDVSGLNFDDLRLIVYQDIDSFESSTLTVTIEGQLNEVAVKDLGISVDDEASFERFVQAGEDVPLKLTSLFGRRTIYPVYHIDSKKFLEKTSQLFSKHESASLNATISYRSGQFFTVDAKGGRRVDMGQLSADLRNRIEFLSVLPLQVKVIDVAPKVEAGAAGRALEKVKLLSKQKVVLAFGSDRWDLGGSRLIDVLRFYPSDQTGDQQATLKLSRQPISVRSINISSDAPAELEVGLNGQAVFDFVSKIAAVIDSETIDATAKFEGDRVVEFTPARDGQKLDVERTYGLLLEKISIKNPSSEPVITINLPVAVTPARIASSEISNLGIIELVGRGVSYFGGSIPNRIFNLTLGSKRVSGVIVNSGEIFSFNKFIGEVSGATGYKPAYVIQKGRTVLDDGGGVCQVSTTVFRAALNAGLPVVSRTAHAYRVGYYEQGGFKAGLDATVWSPAVDFQFKNDTENSILVQAVADPAAAKLQVDIYGTRDGRRVEMTEPVVSNFKPAPEPLYQDDPSLPKGTTKQVDFAAQGATSVFTRKVYKGDKLILDDTFKSNFRPWQAVFLVGTGG